MSLFSGKFMRRNIQDYLKLARASSSLSAMSNTVLSNDVLQIQDQHSFALSNQ